MTIPNRWLIAVAAIFMQLALGAVYAWSVFRIPLTKAHGWTIPQVTLVFQVTVFICGFAAFTGGLWMRRSGPRPVAFTAAVLYGVGIVLAGMSDSLNMLYLTYGLIAGVGLGFGYIIPIATLVKWFPDKRGMITGVAVAGFGSGSLVTAPVANSLIVAVGVGRTFEILGCAYFVIVFLCAFWMRNPPAGYAPAGYQGQGGGGVARSKHDFSLKQALATWQWYALWLTLFLNTTVGIAIISQASPMAQEIAGVSAATAAGLVGLISIANGSGRFLWAWLSDAIGRRTVFLIMFLLQSVVFFLLASVHEFGMLSILACLILLCYGGGFGTMPAFAADYFGSGQIAPIYGMMLTAWGFAAAFGPTLVASVREATGHYQGAMRWLALATLLSAVLPLLLRPPKEPKTFSE
jgi:MFS transporter, OFA family, oxalate/formate antiporter